ncbi:chromosome partition protein MukE [Shigella flexneri]
MDNHAFLMDFQEYLEEFYARYNVQLIRAPEGSSTTPTFHGLIRVPSCRKWI